MIMESYMCRQYLIVTTAVGLSMDDNMRAELCAATVENTAAAYPEFCCAVLHSDRGSQYTRASYRAALNEYGVKQSMNSAGGRCHDNARRMTW